MCLKRTPTFSPEGLKNVTWVHTRQDKTRGGMDRESKTKERCEEGSRDTARVKACPEIPHIGEDRICLGVPREQRKEGNTESTVSVRQKRTVCCAHTYSWCGDQAAIFLRPYGKKGGTTVKRNRHHRMSANYFQTLLRAISRHYLT